MNFNSLWKLRDRLLGLRDPAEKPSAFEMLTTLLWISLLALCVLLFWPTQGGAFIYEGF